MLSKLKNLLKKQNETAEIDDDSHLKLAVAALLVEAARQDEDYAPEEEALITRILQAQFDLSFEQANAIRIDGEAAQKASHDLYRFSSIVKDQLDHDGKIDLVENLWRIILSDDIRTPHEDALMRRLIGLIYISDQESNAARRRVEAQ